MSGKGDGDPLGEAIDAMAGSARAFTFDGDLPAADHESGAPESRRLVLGEEDPRDSGLAEHVVSHLKRGSTAGEDARRPRGVA